MPMRVLFAVHHPLDERLGAPSVSLAIGAALAQLGHDVEYHGYDQAYPGRQHSARSTSSPIPGSSRHFSGGTLGDSTSST